MPFWQIYASFHIRVFRLFRIRQFYRYGIADLPSYGHSIAVINISRKETSEHTVEPSPCIRGMVVTNKDRLYAYAYCFSPAKPSVRAVEV